MELAVTVEGAAGLTWPRWKRFVDEVESLGFAGLFMADHFTPPIPVETDSLELTVALTYLAHQSQQVHFGSLVSPLSFRDPVFLARQAMAIDDLSNGRMILGVGAGWSEREHTMFGYDLGDVSTRLDRLAEGLAVITQLIRSDDPVTFSGNFYRLQAARLLPRPQRAAPIDVQFIGLLGGLGQVVWAAAALPAGRLSNRIGLRNGLMLGYALFGVGLALLLLVESRPAPQWQAWLMASQVIFWLGTALITVTIPPYVMAVTGEQERRHAFAAFSATIPFMALVGSLIGGVLPGLLASRLGLNLDQPAPYRLALWLGPILACGTIWILSGADPVQVTRQDTQQLSTTRAPLALLALFGLVTFLGAIGEGTVRTFFTVYLDMALGVAPAAIGAIMGVAQLLPIGAALILPLLVARWGNGHTLAAGLLGASIFLVLLAAIPLIWVAAIAYIGGIALVTTSSTARDMFGQEIVLPRWRTTSQGVAIVGLALGWSLAGIGGGALIKASGFGALYFAGALTSLLAAGLLTGYLRRAGRRPSLDLDPSPMLPEEAPL